jgi:hypothetical protein
MPESPTADPRNSQASPTAVQPDSAGQESTAGPSGQTPTGRKVQGQQTVVNPGADGVETSWGYGGKTEGRRPNRAATHPSIKNR